MLLFFSQNKPLSANVPFEPQITPSSLSFPADTSLLLGKSVDFSGGIASWEIMRAGQYATVMTEGSSVGVGMRNTAARITVSMPSNNTIPPPGSLDIGRVDEIRFRCYGMQGEDTEMSVSIMQEFRK